MCGQFYGWIGKTRKNVSNKEITDTSKYIIHYMIENGAQVADLRNEKIRTKNLLVYDKKYFYVLSIGVNQKMWAPYLFIDKLPNVYLLLTQDGTIEGEGKLWVLEYHKDMDLTETAGKYYSLPMSRVGEDKGQIFDKNNTDELKKLLKMVMTNA